MSTPLDGAVAATTLATTKTTVPRPKSLRRPHTSPAWPSEMSSEAKTRE